MLKQKFFSSILLLGCASNPQATSAPSPDRIIATDERVGMTIRSPNDAGPAGVMLPASVDSVMSAVALSYAFFKVPITHYDKATGEQGNRSFVMSRTFARRSISDYLNCGDDPFRGPNANANSVTVSLVTRARPLDATRTVLETTLSGFTSKPGNSGAIYCASTGSLEQHIAEMVASRLTKAP